MARRPALRRVVGGETAAEVGPAAAIGNHPQPGRFFHDRVVDGNICDVLELLRVQLQRRATARCCFGAGINASLARLEQVGGVLAKFVDRVTCREAEHARVPKMDPTGQERLSDIQFGFLDESNHRVNAFTLLLGIKLNVAVAGLRRGRTNTERNDPPFQCRSCRRLNDSLELIQIIDQVIRWKHQHHRIVTMTAADPMGCRSNCASSISAKRLQHKPEWDVPIVDLLAFIAREEIRLAVRDNDDLSNVRKQGGTLERLLKQAFAVGQLE